MNHIHIVLSAITPASSAYPHGIKCLLALDPKQLVSVLIRANQHAIEVELAGGVVEGLEAEINGDFAELVS